jgi:predicted nucleic acid-binding protein
VADAVVFDTSAFLTLTDAFVAATAQRLNATLVHKDPSSKRSKA